MSKIAIYVIILILNTSIDLIPISSNPASDFSAEAFAVEELLHEQSQKSGQLRLQPLCLTVDIKDGLVLNQPPDKVVDHCWILG